jgi:hypothetical protein
MKSEDRKEVIDLIEHVIRSYETMLQKIVIEKDKEFNSVPYETAMDALKKVLNEHD